MISCEYNIFEMFFLQPEIVFLASIYFRLKYTATVTFLPSSFFSLNSFFSGVSVFPSICTSYLPACLPLCKSARLIRVLCVSYYLREGEVKGGGDAAHVLFCHIFPPFCYRDLFLCEQDLGNVLQQKVMYVPGNKFLLDN